MPVSIRIATGVAAAVVVSMPLVGHVQAERKLRTEQPSFLAATAVTAPDQTALGIEDEPFLAHPFPRRKFVASLKAAF